VVADDRADHPGVRRDDHGAVVRRRPFGDRRQCLARPLDHALGRLERGWASVVGQESGVRQVDLVGRQALPLTGVGLAEPMVDPDLVEAEVRRDDAAGLGGTGERARPHRLESMLDRGQCTARVGGLPTAEIVERRVGETLPATHGVPLALPVPQQQHRHEPSDHPDAG